MADGGKLRLEIITPYGKFYDGIVDSVTVRVKDGEMGIMHMHTPMVAALVPGETRMLEDGVWKYCATSNGYAEIGHDLVIVVVSAAEWPENIDIRRSEEAFRRASERYLVERAHPVLASRDRHAMQRAKARQDVAKKRSHLPEKGSSPAI
jgi:F-type H+-transporting ATPase subunit epsilon